MRKRFFIAQEGKLVEVNEETRKSINQLTNRSLYLERKKRKECIAGRRGAARCDGDCHRCCWYAPKTASVEAMSGQLNTQPADRGRYNSELQYRCAEIIIDAARVDPDGEKICRMILMNYSAAEIAFALNIPLSTYYSRLKRIARKLTEDASEND